MKKFLKTFILAICLILPAMFCLTACNNKTAKVLSFSVELANESYTMVDDTITIEYGEDYRLSFSDFSVTATFDDETSKTLTASELEVFGFTLLSTIPNDKVTPVGEYTLTLGNKNVSETDYYSIKVNVTRKTIDINAIGLTWIDEETPFVYDGEYHTNEITNLPDYLEIEGHNDNREMYPNGAIYPGTNITIGSTYYAQVSLKVKDEYSDRYVLGDKKSIQHPWTIAKATMEMPSFELKELTYNGTEQKISFTSASAKILSDSKISWSFSGQTQQTNAGTYEASISFSYNGEDKTFYDLGEDYLIGTLVSTWTISPAIIDFSNVYLTSKTSSSDPIKYDFANELTYSKDEYIVGFDGIECDLSLDNDFYSYEYDGDNSNQTTVGGYSLDIEYSIKNESDRQNFVFIYNKPSNSEISCTCLNSYTAKLVANWEIKPFEIDTNNIKLKYKVDGSYIDYDDTAFVYDGEEKSVVFDLSSLAEYVEDTIYPFEISEGLPSTGVRSDIILEYYSADEAVFSATDAGTYTATIEFRLATTFCPDALNYTLSNTTITREWKINAKELTNLELYLTDFEYDNSTRNYVCVKTLSTADGVIDGDNVTLTIKACRSNAPSNGTYELWYNEDMQGEVEIIACNNNNYIFKNGSNGCGKAYVFDKFDVNNGITVGRPSSEYYIVELELDANSSMKYRFETSTDSILFTLKDENLGEISYNDGFTLTNEDDDTKKFVIYMIVPNFSEQGTIKLYNHRAVLMDGENVYQTLNVVDGYDLSEIVSSKTHYTFGGWYTGANQQATTITSDITLYGKWIPIDYTITYTNTESMENTNPTTYNIESEITLISLADKVDYTFDGWYYNNEKITTIPKGFTGGNITLQARWTQKEAYMPLDYAIDEFGGVTINGVKDKSTLTSVTIPNAVVEIFRYAFQYCTALESVTFEEGCKLTTISNGAFLKCTALKQITIPKTIVVIVDNAFEGCSALTSVTFENDSVLTTINGLVFADCISLKQITIPKSVTTIKSSIFRNCTALTTVTFEEGSTINTIGRGMFYGCSALTTIVFPSSVTTLEPSVFANCSALTSVIIPSGVTEIADITFEGCSSLTSIVVPDGVTSIGWNAFYGCTSLTSIVMSSKVTSIGSSAFDGCTALSKIYYKGTAEDWEKITISSNGNACLTADNICYYSESEPTETGNYWCYVEGVPTVWQVSVTEE